MRKIPFVNWFIVGGAEIQAKKEAVVAEAEEAKREVAIADKMCGILLREITALKIEMRKVEE